jgi:hypothetical protein
MIIVIRTGAKRMGWAGKGGDAIGSATGQYTQADLAGILKQGNALGSTSAHIYKLKAPARITNMAKPRAAGWR